MKAKAILAAAIAGSFVASVAMAGGMHRSAEVQTPASVSESAPWLTGQPHLAGWTAMAGDNNMTSATRRSDSARAIGASPGRGAEGVGTFGSSTNERTMSVTPLMPGHMID
jgi:hypothetical protein